MSLMRNGLYFIGMVKNGHREFCKKYFESHAFIGNNISAAVSMVHSITDEGFRLIATGWNEPGPKDSSQPQKMLVSTCGSGSPGSQVVRKRKCVIDRQTVQEYIREIPRSITVETYFENANAIDIHNHLRQGGLALEKHFRTTQWDKRVFFTLLGIIMVNSFSAFKYFTEKEMIHLNFVSSIVVCPSNHAHDLMQRSMENLENVGQQ